MEMLDSKGTRQIHHVHCALQRDLHT